MSQVTTHVLDTTAGRPAAGVAVTLERDDGVVAHGTTDADGRIAGLGPDRLDPGTYRLRFDTAGLSELLPRGRHRLRRRGPTPTCTCRCC